MNHVSSILSHEAPAVITPAAVIVLHVSAHNREQQKVEGELQAFLKESGAPTSEWVPQRRDRGR
jgi:hypothetical protein